MSEVLKSHVGGRWVVGEEPAAELRDPTTEAVIARASTRGVDFRAAMARARDVGGPALRALTFAERGELLAAAASAIHARRDELLELSTRSGGNTRGDAKFDVDGASGTMSHYAELGKSLGDAHVLVDGEPHRLSRSPRFIGRHVLVPRCGVAVHVNAYNFPAWGFGEKAAVALLAGMPVVTKPATSTAPLAARIVEILVEDAVFPDGVLSFIAGSAGDLLDHLGPQDVVAFTGSSDTGYRIRSRENVLRQSVRVNVEADSLNAAVVGPDVEPATETWDLFIRETARDVTQKAGQKCTAIRRLFVPRERLAEAADDLAEEVRRVRVGDPSLKEVRMGPVATADQLRDVREGIERLLEAGRAVLGDGGRGELVGVEGDRGYFVSPVVVRVDHPEDATIVHEREVFGPAVSVMPHPGTATDAARLVGLGAGGLVSSVYSDDREFVAELALGLAPWHGRLHLGSKKVAEHSLGPGTVLPQLVHGGPGRAGGGEELGGPRGMELYMQRTALQGDEPFLARVLARSAPIPR